MESIPHCPEPRKPDAFGQQFIILAAKRGLTPEKLAIEAIVPLLAVKAIETGPEIIESIQAVLGVLDAKLIITKDTITLTTPY